MPTKRIKPTPPKGSTLDKPVLAKQYGDNAETARRSKVPKDDFRFTTNMSKKLHKELKIYAAENDRTMGDVIEDAIRAYIASPAK